ncbi:uncharacterized protein LOC134840768 [Symsagittifera roscoffensis]|uniref:uncharacterized protein LOC134840768 n=1 Tax=Symsagittifera roscoffensis TaxID=84072 RepID=UPI00307BFCE9
MNEGGVMVGEKKMPPATISLKGGDSNVSIDFSIAQDIIFTNYILVACVLTILCLTVLSVAFLILWKMTGTRGDYSQPPPQPPLPYSVPPTVASLDNFSSCTYNESDLEHNGE